MTESTNRSPARSYAVSATRQWAPYVLLASGIFLANALIGMAVGTGNGPATMLPITATGADFAAPGAVQLFVHNAVLSLQLVGGSLLGGLPTLYLTGYNGFLLGHVVSSAVTRFGVPTTVALLAPHGVFELPAVWLAAAVSFRWVHVLVRVATATSRRRPVAVTFLETLVVLALAGVLLVVAAVVESTVTPAVANAVADATAITLDG